MGKDDRKSRKDDDRKRKRSRSRSRSRDSRGNRSPDRRDKKAWKKDSERWERREREREGGDDRHEREKVRAPIRQEIRWPGGPRAPCLPVPGEASQRASRQKAREMRALMRPHHVGHTGP